MKKLLKKWRIYVIVLAALVVLTALAGGIYHLVQHLNDTDYWIDIYRERAEDNGWYLNDVTIQGNLYDYRMKHLTGTPEVVLLFIVGDHADRIDDLPKVYGWAVYEGYGDIWIFTNAGIEYVNHIRKGDHP